MKEFIRGSLFIRIDRDRYLTRDILAHPNGGVGKMKINDYKKIKLVLALSGIPTSLATTYKIANWIYQKAGKDMLPWIFIAMVAVVSIAAYIYVDHKEKLEKGKTQQKERSDSQNKLQSAMDTLKSDILNLKADLNNFKLEIDKKITGYTQK